jgi:hypothetical protein
MIVNRLEVHGQHDQARALGQFNFIEHRKLRRRNDVGRWCGF